MTTWTNEEREVGSTWLAGASGVLCGATDFNGLPLTAGNLGNVTAWTLEIEN